MGGEEGGRAAGKDDGRVEGGLGRLEGEIAGSGRGGGGTASGASSSVRHCTHDVTAGAMSLLGIAWAVRRWCHRMRVGRGGVYCAQRQCGAVVSHAQAAVRCDCWFDVTAGAM